MKIWGTCGCLSDECECSMFAPSTELVQLVSQGPVGWVRGAGIGTGGAGWTEGLCWCSGDL